MAQTNPELATLIGSRICHDLISPIGAIGNGLELLQMEATVQAGPELALISESVENANARIRFFRIAYGLASEGQSFGRAEICDILAGIQKGGRLRFHWETAGDLPRTEVRLAFVALQCIELALPYGGDVWISHDQGRTEIRAQSTKIRVDGALWETLSAPKPCREYRPSEVQFALLPVLLSDENRKIRLTIDETEISLKY